MSSGKGKAVPKTPMDPRAANPITYPCWSSGKYKMTKNCRAACCIVAPKTPDSEESPKWVERKRLQDQMDAAQSAKKAKKPRTPPSFASSSFSPSDEPEMAAFHGRRQTRRIMGQNPDAYTPKGIKSRRHRVQE